MRQAERESWDTQENVSSSYADNEVYRIAAETAAINTRVTEILLGRDGVNIPEHFLDELTCVLMSDPVQLPQSRRVVDRSTITRHIQQYHSDPFNRQTLSLDQLIPLDMLQAEIEAFLSSHNLSLANNNSNYTNSTTTTNNNTSNMYSHSHLRSSLPQDAATNITTSAFLSSDVNENITSIPTQPVLQDFAHSSTASNADNTDFENTHNSFDTMITTVLDVEQDIGTLDSQTWVPLHHPDMDSL